MGGDAWWQTGPYQREPIAAFRQAQERELARDDRGFPGRTMAELWEDEDWQEFIMTGGTGTVLDLYAMVDPTDAKDGPFLRPLTDDEVRAWVPHGRPTYDEWSHALEWGQLPYPGRAGGHCTVLYRDGEPSEIGYWGVTAD